MYKSTAHIIFIGYSNKFFLALYSHKSSLLLSNNSYRKLRKLKYLWFPIFFCCWGKKKTNVTKGNVVVQIDKTCSWYINIYLTTIVLRLFASLPLFLEMLKFYKKSIPKNHIIFCYLTWIGCDLTNNNTRTTQNYQEIPKVCGSPRNFSTILHFETTEK